MMIKNVWQFLYRLYAVRDHVTLGKNVHLGLGTILWSPTKLVIGNNVYIGKNCTIECDGIIGDQVLIGNLAGLIGRYDHDFKKIGKPMWTTNWIGDKEYQGDGKNLQINIENDVWIGYGAIVLSGVRIGRGAIIGAGAVVSKDIASYSIAVGVPAKVVAKRFTRTEIDEHELMVYGKVW